MGRLVEPARTIRVPRPGGGNFESAGGGTMEIQVGGDDFLSRTAKYVPTEILAAYVFLDKTIVGGPRLSMPAVDASTAKLAGVANSGLGLEPFYPIAIFFMCLLLTPFYISMRSSDGVSASGRFQQALVATFAFAVWSYAMQSSLFTMSFGAPYYDAKLAAIMIVGFSLISGCIRPTESVPKGERL